MYIPESFRIEDRDTQYEFIAQYGFATLISVIDGSPFATHLPVSLDRDRHRLVGHVARANPHWRAFDGSTEALAIFHGPHSYISPSWYASTPTVPTWNFTAVHVYGTPTTFDDPDRLGELVDRLVAEYESHRPEPWPNDLPADYREGLLKGIVGFEMPIERIEAKLKLGQNRSEDDQASMLRHLEAGGVDARSLAEFIRGPLNRGRRQ